MTTTTTTTTTPAAVLAAEIKRLAEQYRIVSQLYVTDSATANAQAEASGNLHAAIDRLREMAEGAQGEAVAWRWIPSSVWKDYVYTDDPAKAQEARAFVSEFGGPPVEALAPVAAKHAEPDPVTEACRLPAAVRKRIDAAANAMSWAMAFNDLGAEADGFARALGGLRALQANDTAAPAAVTPHVLGVGIYHPAMVAAPTTPASTDRAMGEEGRVPVAERDLWDVWAECGSDPIELARWVEMAHGITTPPSGATNAEEKP